MLIKVLTQASIALAVMASSAWANTLTAGDLVVFTCVNGKINATQINAAHVTEKNDIQRMIRNGIALRANHIDLDTVKAASEGRGVWGLANIAAVFQLIGTQTPHDIMAAVALTETGRQGRHWPWAINHDGRSLYFSTMAEAVNHAKGLIDQGKPRFDVGLMQVNWFWNGYRFSSIEQAFNPAANILVADAILQEHYQATSSWIEAVGRYHSKTPSLKHAYQRRAARHHQTIVQQTPDLRNQPCVTS